MRLHKDGRYVQFFHLYFFFSPIKEQGKKWAAHCSLCRNPTKSVEICLAIAFLQERSVLDSQPSPFFTASWNNEHSIRLTTSMKVKLPPSLNSLHWSYFRRTHKPRSARVWSSITPLLIKVESKFFQKGAVALWHREEKVLQLQQRPPSSILSFWLTSLCLWRSVLLYGGHGTSHTDTPVDRIYFLKQNFRSFQSLCYFPVREYPQLPKKRESFF